MATKFLNISTDATLSENSNTLVPSQKAVRNFVASKSIHLNFLQSTTPTSYSTGQKWLNTSDNKLYTATSASAWDSGVAINADQFFTYLDLLYYFDGSSIKAYSTLTITEQRAGTQVKTWVGTREQYNNLTSYDPTTIYEVIEPSGSGYITLATQTEFNNSSGTTASTPYQVNQALGNYLSKTNGGYLAASKVLGLTNANNEVSELAFNTSGQLTVSTGLYVTNALDTNSVVVRTGNVYKINTSGAKVVWDDSYTSSSNYGVAKVDGTTITANNGTISIDSTYLKNYIDTAVAGMLKPMDWSNAVELTLNSSDSYSCPNDGYIVCRQQTSTVGSLVINNKTAISWNSTASIPSNISSGTALSVLKNDVVTTSAQISLTFVPYKS